MVDQMTEACSPAETARRLAAIMKLLECDTVQQFAALIGGNRSQVSNWLQGYHFPKVPEMATLCERTNNDLTLDWIYRGVQTGLPYGVAVHLVAILENIARPVADPNPPLKPITPQGDGNLRGGLRRQLRRRRRRRGGGGGRRRANRRPRVVRLRRELAAEFHRALNLHFR